MSALTTPTGSGANAKVVGALDELDQRYHPARLRKQFNKVFPTHWVFLLGEVALYSFIVLLLSGTYLALFFDPSSFPEIGAYCAAKSAEWSLTNALRLQLADQGIRVAGLHVGYMDTDMVAGVTADKSDPADIARIAIDGVAAGAYEILADDASRQTQAALAVGVSAIYPQLP